MRGALLRNFSLYTRNLQLYHNLKPTNSVISNYRNNYITEKAPLLNPFSSPIRFFCSQNENPDPNPKHESENSTASVEEKNDATADVEDVSNKDFKVQLDDYLHNFNEEQLPTIFESIFKRMLSGKHVETDDKLREELQPKPIDNISNEDFESDMEELVETDDEIDDLYSTREIAIKKMTTVPKDEDDGSGSGEDGPGEDDQYFHMNDKKWDEMIQEATEHGILKDTRECEAILEDMLKWDKLLPDEIKEKVEKKFNEIGDRIENGELEVEEGYALFKEFEDQMVLECAELMEAEEPPNFGENVDDKGELDDPPGEGPILRWETRVVFSPGGDAWHPKNRKVKMAVTVKELGLSKPQFVRLRELSGKRYNPGKDELTITSERFEHREENRKDCLRTLFSLIEEAGKARKLVNVARTLDVKERLKANPKFMERLQAKIQVAKSNPVLHEEH